MNAFSPAILSLLGLAFTCSSSPLAAQDIVTFTNGTRADADAVNANFQAVNNKATAAATAAAAAATVAAAAKTKADAAATQASVNTLNNSVTTLNNSVTNLTSAIAVTAPKVQLDRRLQFPNSPTSNRTIVLFDGSNNDHQFYGFGISGNTLRHHVIGSADSHVFFAGASPTTSTELMRIKGDGKVGIGTSTPTEKLSVNGEIRFGPTQLLRPVASVEESLRIIRGVVNSDGTRVLGTGFTSSRTATGTYRINFDYGFADYPVLTATVWENGEPTAFDNTLTVVSRFGYADVRSYDIRGDNVKTLQDVGFHFIVIGPR